MRFLLCGLVLLTSPLVAALPKIDEGAGQMEVANDGEPLTVYTYKPSGYREGPLLVVLHGVQRNAQEYRDFAIPLAERFGALVVAPLFDQARFPTNRYQRGGVLTETDEPVAAERWTFAAIPRIVAAVREAEGRPGLPFYLIGHSAGGQFLVRMTAFSPGEARRIVAANPGSLLFPVREQKFGYGFGGLPPDLQSDDAVRRYLAAPLTLYLGTGDVLPSNNFDASAEAMLQGASRLERGRACFAAAEKLAKERGWEFGWRKVETPGIGHSATRMFAAKEVEDALFGHEPARAGEQRTANPQR